VQVRAHRGGVLAGLFYSGGLRPLNLNSHELPAL